MDLFRENYVLKQRLSHHGLPTAGMMGDGMSNASGGLYVGSSPASNSNSYGLPSATTQHTPFTPSAISGTAAMSQGLSPSGFSPPKLSPGYQASSSRRPSATGSATGQISPAQRNANIDYEQAGIDFVLQ